MKQQTRVAVPDLHVPFHDPLLWKALLSHIRSLKPDGVDIIGDVLDCYSLSRFDKNPARKESIQDEVDDARKLLVQLRAAAGDSCEIRFSEGNHEQRLRHMLWGHSKALAPLRGLSIPQLLDLESLGITYHEPTNPYAIGDLWYLHGDVTRKQNFSKSPGGRAAADVAKAIGGSVLMGHCFSEDTEILTPTGWKNHSDLIIGSEVMTYNRQTCQMEPQSTTGVYRYTHYKELITCRSDSVSLSVTPDHGLWAHERDRPYKEYKAQELEGKRCNMLACAPVVGDDIDVPDDILRLVAWIMADGSIDRPTGHIRISQSEAPDGRMDRVETLLHRCGVEYSKSKRYEAATVGHGVYRNYDAYRLGLHKSESWWSKVYRCIDRGKTPTYLLQKLSSRQSQLFLEEYSHADGHRRGLSFQVNTARPDYKDLLQALAARSGWRSSVSRSNDRNHWTLTVRRINSVFTSESLWERKPYSGTVWCASVPNGTLVVRNGGRTLVTLNTHQCGYGPFQTWERQLRAWEIGCLCHFSLDYIVGVPPWQQGWATVDFTKSGFFQVCFMESIVKGYNKPRTLMFCGEVFKTLPPAKIHKMNRSR